MKKRLIGFHHSWRIMESSSILSLDEQALLLRQADVKLAGPLRLAASLNLEAEMPQCFGQRRMGQGIIGVGGNGSDEQVASAQKIVRPQFGAPLRVKPRSLFVGGQGRPGSIRGFRRNRTYA